MSTHTRENNTGEKYNSGGHKQYGVDFPNAFRLDFFLKKKMISIVGQKCISNENIFYNFVDSQTPNLRPRRNHSDYPVQSPHC